jgi:hypothetical protein
METAGAAGRIKFKCAVGETAVYTGAGIIQEIPQTVSSVFCDGFLCVLYDANLRAAAQLCAAAFKAAGYRVLFTSAEEEKNLPEYVRFVFAVGAGKAAACAKSVAKRMGIEYDLLLTAPTTDTILCIKAPKQVFIDENIIVNCPKRCVAAGWGIVLSQSIKNFEDYFADKVLCENDNARLKKAPYKELPYDCDNIALAVRLLELSLNKNMSDSAEIMAVLLSEGAKKKGKTPRLIGEYKFVCASALSVFYSSYLGSPAIDVTPPAERDEIFDAIALSCNIPRENISKRIDFFDCSRYFRISYILSEYRMDLLEKLSGAEFHTVQRFWRRIYTDAGYWLKSALSVKDVTQALCMASVLSDGLLGFVGASGFTSGFAA